MGVVVGAIDKILETRRANWDICRVNIGTWVSCGSPESTTLDDPNTKSFWLQKTLSGRIIYEKGPEIGSLSL